MLARRPAVAGLFYPDDPQELRAMVRGFLTAAAPPPEGARAPKALIVPHAGYVYSGPIAASGYATLRARASEITHVVLLGPAHRTAVRGLAATSAAVWNTPLGPVAIDRAAVDRACALPHVHTNDAAHAQEHSLEVHLPFLLETLGPFQVAPFAVGDATAEEVANVLDALWGGPETLIVISSDLSHYLEKPAAQRIDTETAQAILALDAAPLDGDHACGHAPIAGLLRCARRRNLEVRLLDLRNSGDTAGSPDRVVGYGSFAFASPRVH